MNNEKKETLLQKIDELNNVVISIDEAFTNLQINLSPYRIESNVASGSSSIVEKSTGPKSEAMYKLEAIIDYAKTIKSRINIIINETQL